jgi:hypothetical protein
LSVLLRLQTKHLFCLHEDDRVPLFYNVLKTHRIAIGTDVFARSAIQTPADWLQKFEE